MVCFISTADIPRKYCMQLTQDEAILDLNKVH